MSNIKTSEHEYSEMQDLFTRIDTDGDGYLSTEELENGLGEICGSLQLKSHDIKQMLSSMDTNGDGQVSFQEFMAASTSREKLTCEKTIDSLFQMFDMNGDGYIDTEEL